METLIEYVSGKKPARFTPCPFYVSEGDSLSFYVSNEESYAERVDELLTVYKSIRTEEMVGCQIKGIHAILRKLGSFGVKLENGQAGLMMLFCAYQLTTEVPPPRETIEGLLETAAHSRVGSRFKASELIPA